MHVYGMNMQRLTVFAATALGCWGFVRFVVGARAWGRAVLKCAGVALAAAALYGVLTYTVLGRVPDGSHEFVWYSYHRGEFVREMFMNALLYVPLGVGLAELAGPWGVAAALALSVGVESWQYVAGTGLAQGTDVLCNTLGCAVGVLPWVVTERLRARR